MFQLSVPRLRAAVSRTGLRLPVGRLPTHRHPPPDDVCAIAFAAPEPRILITSPPLDGEEWRIVARNADYAVPSLGRVCRVTPAHGTRPGREVHPRISKERRTTVILQSRTVTVAVLVAQAFLPTPLPGTRLYHRGFNGTNGAGPRGQYGLVPL